MYLIAGLGNPGNQYKNTRHNVGFLAADYIAAKNNIKISKIKFKSVYGEGNIGGERVIIAKPSCFMNNSGESIREIASYYKLPPENIIIIYDDVALDVGKIRIRPSGSDGGHNGIKSIIYCLNSNNFPRIRLGVGKPDIPLVNYVLGNISGEDGVKITDAIECLDDAVHTMIVKGVPAAMNEFNGKF